LRLQRELVLPAAKCADDVVPLERGHFTGAEPPADALAIVLRNRQLLAGGKRQPERPLRLVLTEQAEELIGGPPGLLADGQLGEEVVRGKSAPEEDAEPQSRRRQATTHSCSGGSPNLPPGGQRQRNAGQRQ